MEEEFFKAGEAAKLGRMSRRRLQELCAAGDIKAIKPFGRWLVYKAEFLKQMGVL